MRIHFLGKYDELDHTLPEKSIDVVKNPQTFCKLITVYSRITLVVPNYEAAPRLFYSEYFWQRYITCDSAAHQELPMGKIFPEILNLCESRKFCDDPASRSANWDQVNKIFSQFQRNL